jgi:hypothetical protein
MRSVVNQGKNPGNRIEIFRNAKRPQPSQAAGVFGWDESRQRRRLLIALIVQVLLEIVGSLLYVFRSLFQ